MLKNPLANARDIRDASLIPGLGKSPGGGHGNPLQYSCLENPMDRGAWWATVHGASQSWMRLKRPSIHTCTRQATHPSEITSEDAGSLEWKVEEHDDEFHLRLVTNHSD